MCSNGIGQLAGLTDLGNGSQGLGRDFLIKLYIVFELVDHRPRQGFGLVGLPAFIGDDRDLGFEILGLIGEGINLGAGLALDQHLDRAIGQLEQLQHGRNHPNLINGGLCRIIVAGIFLGGQQDLLVAAHHFFKGANRLFPANKQGHHHVRKHNNVTQRQDREDHGLSHYTCFLAGLLRQTPALLREKTLKP